MPKTTYENTVDRPQVKFLAEFPIETHQQLKIFSGISGRTMRLVVADAVKAYVKAAKTAMDI
jgi:hypothetical protein